MKIAQEELMKRSDLTLQPLRNVLMIHSLQRIKPVSTLTIPSLMKRLSIGKPMEVEYSHLSSSTTKPTKAR
jgi:hypothetical protein